MGLPTGLVTSPNGRWQIDTSAVDCVLAALSILGIGQETHGTANQALMEYMVVSRLGFCLLSCDWQETECKTLAQRKQNLCAALLGRIREENPEGDALSVLQHPGRIWRLLSKEGFNPWAFEVSKAYLCSACKEIYNVEGHRRTGVAAISSEAGGEVRISRVLDHFFEPEEPADTQGLPVCPVPGCGKPPFMVRFVAIKDELPELLVLDLSSSRPRRSSTPTEVVLERDFFFPRKQTYRWLLSICRNDPDREPDGTSQYSLYASTYDTLRILKHDPLHGVEEIKTPLPRVQNPIEVVKMGRYTRMRIPNEVARGAALVILEKVADSSDKVSYSEWLARTAERRN